jgi:hypothetical protein
VFHGSAAAFRPSTPVVGIATTPDGNGYWLATGDGTVFAFGDAGGAHRPIVGPGAAPIVAIASDPATPHGYWLLARDGTVYPFGGAPEFGPLTVPAATAMRGIATMPDGSGYWIADTNGTVYAAGKAALAGSAH